MWDRLNSILCRNQLSKYTEQIEHDGAKLTGCLLSEAFNYHFVSITSTKDSFNSTFCDARNEASLFFEPVTESEEISLTFQLKNSGSCDADGIQIKLVKYVVDLIAPSLRHICNLALVTSVFPKRMQIAKVSVLYKKGDRNEMGNYRPISILPVFSKALEKVLHVHLTNFTNKYRLITDSQLGFRRDHSTEAALLVQKEFILQSFEERKIVLAVFVDFSKAFDCLDHEILLKKLCLYGIRGHALQIFRSYLEHRAQYVCLNGNSSSMKPLLCGVPQCSILGPLLFNLYANDVVNIHPKVKFVNYADDTTLLISAEDRDMLVDIANLTLSRLEIWSRENGLKININKTKAVIFRTRNKLIGIMRDVTLNTTPIEIVSNFKVVGVIFSDSMSWDNHINYIIPKLSQITGLIYCHRSILPTNVKLLTYNSLFYLYLKYGHLVWGSTTLSNLEKIFLLQKKF